MDDNDSDEPDIFLTMVTPNSKRDEKPENLDKIILQIQCILPLKAEFSTLKNCVMGKFNMITEKLNTSKHPNNEHTLCREQIKYVREENSSEDLIKKYYLKIKVLLKNIYVNNQKGIKCIMIPMFPLYTQKDGKMP